jgi:hypothetical protein
VKQLLKAIDHHDTRKIKFLPIKLTSKRATPWSALELVKQTFIGEIASLANDKKIDFHPYEVEYPAGEEVIYKILIEAKNQFKSKCNIIIDISAMPRELATYISDSLCLIDSDKVAKNFLKAYAVITSPERVTSRNGYGPFSVGAPKFIKAHGLTESLPSSHKINMLVFPGYEGFEAKAICDLFRGHNVNITCALSCFNYSYSKSLRALIGNQALLVDHISDQISLKYYFSRNDILRVAMEFLEKSVNLYEEMQDREHALIIAAFGPKTAIFLGSLIRKKYVDMCKKINKDAEVFTDVIILPTSQYVSLYSRGYSDPCIFEIQYS